jgi:4-amino-4-deoxychorismate lyase
VILVNGIAANSVAASDRGLNYGDGVFRTMTMRGGKVLHWPLHLAKLQADCLRLDIACPGDDAFAPDIAVITSAIPDCVVKVIVTRGAGLRGYALPAHASPTRIVIASPPAANSHAVAGVNLHLCALRLSHQPALAGIKHLNRLENVLARAEWNDVSILEGLLCDQDGNAVSGTMSNLFIVERGVLVTPELTRCGVAGVTRQRVMQIAQHNRLRCEIENIPLQRIYDADELFLVNSVIGLWPVARLVHRSWVPGTVTTNVKRWLEEDDAAVT